MLLSLECNLGSVFSKEINRFVEPKENIMYDSAELKQRFVIIKNSNLDDATILDENYKQLIRNADNPDEQQQFRILHSTAQRRIEKLTKEVGQSSD